jgi:hypothetical protein
MIVLVMIVTKWSCYDCNKLCFGQVPLGTGKLLPDIDPDTVMNKYFGDTKKKMDREYVVWCCKSAKPLSMAEHDKYFKRFCAAISYGRYTPPCKKISAHELITLVAASREILKGQLKEVLEDECIDISIAGIGSYSSKL